MCVCFLQIDFFAELFQPLCCIRLLKNFIWSKGRSLRNRTWFPPPAAKIFFFIACQLPRPSFISLPAPIHVSFDHLNIVGVQWYSVTTKRWASFAYFYICSSMLSWRLTVIINQCETHITILSSITFMGLRNTSVVLVFYICKPRNICNDFSVVGLHFLFSVCFVSFLFECGVAME